MVVVGTAAELGVEPDVVRSFYRSHWTAPVALPRPDFYDWQFLRHPGGSGGDDTMVALVDDQVVGVMGLDERPFELAGERRRGAEATTWVVAPQARGLGVGAVMLAGIQARFEVFAGAGITEAAQAVYVPAGFHFVRLLPRCVRVHRDDLPEDVARADRLGRRLIELRSPVVDRPFEATSVRDLASIPESALRPPGPGAMNAFVRDAGYLRWRYVDHPAFDHALHLVSGGGDGALVVTRLGESGGFRFCHVLDVLGDARDLPAVVAFLDAYAAERGAAITDFMGSSAVVHAQLRADGWFSMVDEPWLQVTHLFYPIEFRSPPTTSLILWSKGGLTDLLDVGRLHLTKGDLDLDRPTLAYYEMSEAPAR